MKKKIASILLKLPFAIAFYALYDLMYSTYISCSTFQFNWCNIVIPIVGVIVIEFVTELYRAYVRKHASL